MRQFPLSFWGAGFDATTLPWDFYQRADYPGAGIVWPGTPSAGSSGSHSCTIADTATKGPAVNGKIPANFASQVCAADTTCDKYITPTAYSGAALFRAASADPDQGAFPYLCSQIMAAGTNAIFGVNFSVDGVSVWGLSSGVGYVQIPFACAVGSFHLTQFYYDNANLHARLDSGLWSSVAMVSGFNGINLNTQNFRLGLVNYSATNYQGRILEAGLSKQQFALLDFDKYLSYVNRRYGLSL